MGLATSAVGIPASKSFLQMPVRQTRKVNEKRILTSCQRVQIPPLSEIRAEEPCLVWLLGLKSATTRYLDPLIYSWMVGHCRPRTASTNTVSTLKPALQIGFSLLSAKLYGPSLLSAKLYGPSKYLKQQPLHP